MIFIDLLNNMPPEELIQEGLRLTKKLRELPPDKRSEFINKNNTYWGKLKEHLSKLSNGKCWYTEAKDKASYCQVDHFRPKNAVKCFDKCDVETCNSPEAYWWLAFDWTNYRLSASAPNTIKNAYFPLKQNTIIATRKEEICHEWPGLIDPTDDYDILLITFDIDGKVHSVCSDKSHWDYQRVKLSVSVYDLDRVSLVDARKMLQQRCRRISEEIIEEHKRYISYNDPAHRESIKKRIVELRELTIPQAEFSAVARNYVRNHDEEFIRNISTK